MAQHSLLPDKGQSTNEAQFTITKFLNFEK